MTHPSIDKHIKRIQSQLNRLNVRASKEQIRAIYQQLVADFANPTDEERAAVVEKLSLQSESSELVTVEVNADELEAIAPGTEEKILTQETTATNPEPETENPVLTAANNSSSLTTQASSGIALQPSEKQNLIAQQAAALSVNLNSSELQTVAAAVADNYTSFEEACQRIQSIIVTVLEQRHLRAAGVLNDTLLTIVNKASGDFQDLNQKASQGFNLISEHLGQTNTDFKSQAAAIEESLRAFLL